jgi:protein-disulfide isomerase
MPSSTMTKRELREQRRAERLAAEAAEAARSTRHRRLVRLLAAVGVAAAAVVIAAVVSSSGSKPAAPATPQPAVTSVLAGIPEHGGVLGNPNAPITLTEYVDLQCPVCAEAARDTLPQLIRTQVRTGKVKLDARTLHFIGPDSQRAALVAAGAEQQGKLWPFLLAFYGAQGQENSGYVTDGFLRDVAQAAGVDAGEALAYADTAAAQQRVNRADADAQRLGVNSTPTFTIAKGSGAPRALQNHDIGTLDQAIAQAAKA